MGNGMGYPIYIPSLKTLGISMCKFENGTWRWLLSYYYINMNKEVHPGKIFKNFLEIYIQNLKILKYTNV
ncbi:MAG: hypothetical protein RE471_09940 [Ferroplasma sp.]|uniref:hypothetical protein n=1 Tax=Ferroplasma sp. TaxID=2591003 RepID=UPI0028161BD7|nr:hypothetical protein [Ferroplasma sp.]WMT51241.1 MAG: hypothetical protein RE471_09720 [Ferroplasma sp.]WMT51284.1 MAG: hypothetical protein RE471_09940 [Ferroplasma sp.]